MIKSICEICYTTDRNKTGENCCVKCYYDLGSLKQTSYKAMRHCRRCGNVLMKSQYFYCGSMTCQRSLDMAEGYPADTYSVFVPTGV